MNCDLRRIRSIADYQFGLGCGDALFSEGVTLTYSKKTGRIKHIYSNGVLLASLRAMDGLLTLTINGMESLVSKGFASNFTLKVTDEAARFIAQGRNVFAKHVTESEKEIRPGDEVAVIDHSGEVLAVGKAFLNGEEMLTFNVGVAVKVRRGRLRDI